MGSDWDFTDCQVVFSHQSVWDEFMAFLRYRGLKTFPIPVEDDLPTFGIAFDS